MIHCLEPDQGLSVNGCPFNRSFRYESCACLTHQLAVTLSRNGGAPAKRCLSFLAAQVNRHDPDLLFRHTLSARGRAGVFVDVLRRLFVRFWFLSHRHSLTGQDEREILRCPLGRDRLIGAEVGYRRDRRMDSPRKACSVFTCQTAAWSFAHFRGTWGRLFTCCFEMTPLEGARNPCVSRAGV